MAQPASTCMPLTSWLILRVYGYVHRAWQECSSTGADGQSFHACASNSHDEGVIRPACFVPHRLVLINLEATHEIPRIAEPFWLALKATVEIIPVMAQDDFAQAAQFIEQAAKKYR
jgi:hypothetical protein